MNILPVSGGQMNLADVQALVKDSKKLDAVIARLDKHRNEANAAIAEARKRMAEVAKREQAVVDRQAHVDAQRAELAIDRDRLAKEREAFEARMADDAKNRAEIDGKLLKRKQGLDEKNKELRALSRELTQREARMAERGAAVAAREEQTLLAEQAVARLQRDCEDRLAKTKELWS